MRKFLSIVLSFSLISSIAIGPAIAVAAPTLTSTLAAVTADMDMDMDGTLDSVDSTVTALPVMDMDMDGIPDAVDMSITPDYMTMDMDMDGLLDFGDPILTSMPSMGVTDVDMDGIVDTADTRIIGDMDMDGIADSIDTSFTVMADMSGTMPPAPSTDPTPTPDATMTPTPDATMTPTPMTDEDMDMMMSDMMMDMDTMMMDMTMADVDMDMMMMDMDNEMAMGGITPMPPMMMMDSMSTMPMGEMDMMMMDMDSMKSGMSTMVAEMDAMDADMDMMMTMPMGMDSMMAMSDDIDVMGIKIDAMTADQARMAGQMGMSARTPAVTVRASTLVPNYGASVVVSGKVVLASGEPLPGMPVELKTTGGVSIARTVTSSTGTYSIAVAPRVKTAYVVQSRAAITVSSAKSATLTVDPKAFLTRPVAPTSIAVNRTFSTYGYLKPKHAAGTYPVAIKAYRKIGTKWVLQKTFKAKASDYSTYTKYSIKLALASRGSWKLVAFHDSAAHAATSSSARYLTVK